VTLHRRTREKPDDERGLANPDNIQNTGARGRHRRRRLTWPRLAERLLGGMAPTLRMAGALVAVLAAGLICLLIAWGPLGMAYAALLCVVLLRILRLDTRSAR
jgi:hypothetical protein